MSYNIKMKTTKTYCFISTKGVGGSSRRAKP